jgi:4-diphosphocytidyl-2-C-methyl-D-erythritol kinase
LRFGVFFSGFFDFSRTGKTIFTKREIYYSFLLFMPDFVIDAPGKINLHLRVKGKRPDGYHDLESIFLALQFGDTLRFSLGEPGTLQIRGLEGLAAEENIIFRALALFRAETGFDRGLRVDLEKRIPLGGGLGGGSSDGAAALRALNGLSGAGLSEARLAELAAELGSDVPFFLTGGAAWAGGRGDRIEPLPSPAFPVVLVNPGFPSDTAGAYRLLDAARESPSGAFPGPEADLGPGALIEALGGDPRRWPFFNDFLPVLNDETGGVYREILARLKGLGALFCGLSGAGSTCFGVFSAREGAEKAAEILLKERPFVCVTFPLAR